MSTTMVRDHEAHKNHKAHETLKAHEEQVMHQAHKGHETPTIKRLVALVFVSLMSFAANVYALQPPAAQSEFVPVNQLPPADQLPAAPLLITAYAFVWVAVFAYVWSIWRRLTKVEADMNALGSRITSRSAR